MTLTDALDTLIELIEGYLGCDAGSSPDLRLIRRLRRTDRAEAMTEALRYAEELCGDESETLAAVKESIR